MKPGWREGRVGGATVALVVFMTSVALAHARLVSSSPAAGAHLGQPPRELRLEFSEAVTARTSRVELVAPDSQRMQLALRGDSANNNVLLADVPPLTVAGAYRVEWRLVGPDGHAVTGRYAFTVDSIPAPSRPPQDTGSAMPPMTGQEEMHEPPDSLLQQGVRFLTSLSMLVIIGAVAFRLFVLPAANQTASTVPVFGAAVEETLRKFATSAAWLLLVLAAVRLTSHATLLSGSFGALRGSDFTDLLIGSTFGRGWLLQVAAVIVLLVRFRTAPSVRWSAIAWVTVALAISAPFLGHPSAISDVPAIAMSLDAVHVLAAGGWAGAILMLAVAAMPKLGLVAAADRITVVRDLLRAFSPLALTCAAILVVTGAVSGWLQLRELGLIFGSDYGLMVFRKVVVVLLIAALGAYHWRVAQPSIDSDRSVARLRTSLALDVALVLLVLVITAILTGTAPPVR